MDHLSRFPPIVENEVLFLLEPLLHQNLENRLKRGVISRQEYLDQIYEIAGSHLIERLQISTPGFKGPNLDDKDFNSQEYYKTFAKAMTTDKIYQDDLRTKVQNKAPTLVSKIFDDWENLRDIVGAYLDVINRRWSKRIVDKRKALLLEAWPAMPPVHRPDFDVLRRRLKGPKYREIIMLPYVNLEDLSSPRHLIQLLQSRTKMPPEHFAWADSAPFQAAVEIQAVQDHHASSEIMFLTEKRTRASYGKLQNLTNQAEIEDVIWSGYGFQLVRGLTVLETQAKLYSFLLSVVRLLLHDLNFSNSRVGTNVPQTYRNAEQAPEPREWLSITEANTQAFYNLPQPFSLASLRQLVNAKRDEAEDSFWTLYEDPAFFQTQLSMYHLRKLEIQRRVLELERLSVVCVTESSALKNAWIHIVHKTCRDIVIWTMIATEITRLESLRASLHIDQHPLSK